MRNKKQEKPGVIRYILNGENVMRTWQAAGPGLVVSVVKGALTHHPLLLPRLVGGGAL